VRVSPFEALTQLDVVSMIDITMPPRRPSPQPPTTQKSEALTRKALIDPALKAAGWNVDDPAQVGLEIPVDGSNAAAVQAVLARLRHVKDAAQLYHTPLPPGISDYALYQPNGEIIAVVEAKKTSVDPRLAQAQAEFYVGEIAKHQSFAPFAFMTNGEEIYFLDVGAANKRPVPGFFTPEDLERLLFLRRNHQPLASQPIATSIVDRPYQHEAIRRVAETFDQGKRKALLVMATGTGKTRTAMGLIDLFMRTNQARRILFVADRDELVKQAIDDGFKIHLPSEPCTRIFSDKLDTAQSQRLYAATLQTMSIVFSSFSPGFFDLIIFDEVHRSIFNKWNEVLQYFDARMIGLTATPAEFVERNTFLAFGCDDGVPTFLYSYKQAVTDGYLVDYDLYRAKTKFQRKGIRGVDLSEEDRNILIEQGIDPDEIDFTGTDLEREVSNTDTLRKQWHELWEQCVKDESGQLPGKTIVFAMTQEHALRLEAAFEQTFPQYPGMVRVITSKSNFKGRLIDDFKKEDMPRIAITVDLLETGVDIPEVVNLAFMKPVQSRIKLMQMLGRGTRSNAACKHPAWLPNGRKTGFLVLDFWENDFDKPATEELNQSLPVLVALFNTRLKLLELDLAQPGNAQRTIADLRAMIAHIPIDSFSVKKAYLEAREAWTDSFWSYLTAAKVDLLRLKVGPLLRYAPGIDVAALTFTHKVERLKLQIATTKETAGTAASIAEDVSRLPDFVFDDPACVTARDLCLSPKLASASPLELNQVIDTLAPQIRHRRERPDTFITIDLPDLMEMRGYVLLKGGTEQVYIAEYRKRVEQRIVELIDTHPTIDALGKEASLSDEQLIALERTLRRELGAGDVELSEENIRKAYGYKVGSLLEFLRQVLDLPHVPDYAEIVRRRFEDYITAQQFSSNQIAFLRALQNAFLQKRRLRMRDLYAPPLTAFGADAAERWFDEGQRSAILSFVDTLTVVPGE
jgi:type I restriction enzyme R subunit